MAINKGVVAQAAKFAGNDPELSAALRELNVLAIREIVNMLHNGSPQLRASVARSFVGAFVKESMKEVANSDEMEQIKGELAALREMFSTETEDIRSEGADNAVVIGDSEVTGEGING